MIGRDELKSFESKGRVVTEKLQNFVKVIEKENTKNLVRIVK
jgi:hypothetical protein